MDIPIQEFAGSGCHLDLVSFQSAETMEQRKQMAASEVGLARVDTRKSKKRVNSRVGGSAESSEV